MRQKKLEFSCLSQEGAELLAASGGVIDGTRSEAKKVEEALKANDEENQATNGTANDNEDEGSALKRKGTMQMTAEVAMLFICLYFTGIN